MILIFLNIIQGKMKEMESVYNATQQDKRKIYLDFLRIIAIYMVLFNHTGTKGFMFFTQAQYSMWYPFYLFVSISIKMAVPLFFMISGALLLEREETILKILKKRFVKYLIMLFFASMAVYLYIHLQSGELEMSATVFLQQLYSGKIVVQFWFLYAYLAFILMLPLIRKLAFEMKDVDYKWMIFLYTMLRVMQIVQYLITKGMVSYSSNFSLFISQDSVFYPLMGYYIDRRLQDDKMSKSNLRMLWLLSFVAVAVSCLMTHYKCIITGDWRESTCQTFFNTLIFIPTITVFIAAKNWFLHHDVNEKVRNMITWVGSRTFGIYLIERICRNETEGVFWFFKPYIHTFPACLVWIFVACLFGGIIVSFLKMIPKVNKYI